VVPAKVNGSLGSPGGSALAAYRRRRREELASWTRSLAWRPPLVTAAGLVGQVLTIQAGLVGLAVAALVGWRLRVRPSEQARTWRRGAHGERHTARLLDRLVRDGFVVFHDLAVPGSPANVDHLVIGPTGVFVIDSKQWTGSVHQGADELVWHNYYRLDRTLERVRWEAETLGPAARPGRGHRSHHPAQLGARRRAAAVRGRGGVVRHDRSAAAAAVVLSMAAALLSWFEKSQLSRLVAGQRRGVMSMLGDEHRIRSQHREPVVHPFGVGGVMPVRKERCGVVEGQPAFDLVDLEREGDSLRGACLDRC
jgi:hypothetical protein